MTKVKGGVPIRRVPRVPSVVIQAGQRVFHRRVGGTYDPTTITLRAVVQNVNNPTYRWGHIINGNFRTYNVTLEAMTINPAHAGVIAVRVEGDNIPGYIQATETISIVEDGAPAVQYKIVVKQLDRVVTSISCDNSGNPKIYYTATAYLYKITGVSEELCSDYSCIIAYYRNNTIESSYASQEPVGSYTFNVDGDYDSIRIIFTDGNSIVAEANVPKVYDGAQGNPGCTMRRSEWKLGTEYRNDGALTVTTRYLDMVMVRTNNALGWRGYKCLQTHVSATDNAPGKTMYWEELPTNSVGILTSLIIARDAKLDFLSGNEIGILDANDRVTAGVSGSGSGDTGIRFYAGSDNPQTAPFQVYETGYTIMSNGLFYGSIATPFTNITDDNYLSYFIPIPDGTGYVLNISRGNGFNYMFGDGLNKGRDQHNEGANRAFIFGYKRCL